MQSTLHFEYKYREVPWEVISIRNYEYDSILGNDSCLLQNIALTNVPIRLATGKESEFIFLDCL